MSTLHFDGSSTELTAPAQAAMNGPISVAVLLRRWQLDGVGGPIMRFGADSDYHITFDDKFNYFNGGSVQSGQLINNLDWYIFGISFIPVSGTWMPRFHLKNITQNTAWVHVDASGMRSGIPTTMIGKLVRLGNSPTYSGYIKADIGVAAFWDGTYLTDLQFEALSANKKTSDWNKVPPSTLTELNTVSPVDLKGLLTWTKVGSLQLNGPDPTGWAFDGLGPVPTPNVRMLTKAGWTVVNNRIQTDYTVTPGYTKDRAFDPETAAVQEVARVLGSLVDDLKTAGLIKP